MSAEPDDKAGLVRTLGIEVVRASETEAVCEMTIRTRHLQGPGDGFGVVNGGLHCILIESATSIGANEVARARGQEPPFGVEQSASFIRAARSGKLRVTAKPIATGRTTQVWEATVEDDDGHTIAVGRVRFINNLGPRRE